MSRLYDRVMTNGCRPLQFRALFAPEDRANFDRAVAEGVAELLRSEGHAEAGEDGIQRLLDRIQAGEVGLTATTKKSASMDDGIPVVSAEEVAAYVNTLDPFLLDDLVDGLAPPFPEFFVEVQGVQMRRPLGEGTRAFAGHFQDMGAANGADEMREWCEQHGLAADEVSWVLGCELIVEWEKNEPVGPVWTFAIPVTRDGTWFKDARAAPPFFHWFPEPWLMGDAQELPEDHQEALFENLKEYVAPLLLAVSLMHCKNVDVRPVDPPERLSMKHKRKKGRPLTRYYVLDIQPMRRILDTEGEAQSMGLGHALHICRGHFKTYTEDAPLFGRHTGTYWWASQARGMPGRGTVEKDYRIRLDQGLGRGYVGANEHPDIKPTAPEHTGLDPDLGGRGLRAHNVTQNRLAAAVREAGYEPTARPKPDEPQYDLAWQAGDVTWVAEVKSVTPQNEERQLRTALGQVLRYRQLLEADGRTVRAMIATEVKPSDASWVDLCAREDVALRWGPDNLRAE